MFILQNLWNVNLIHAFLTLLSFGYFKIFVGIVCASLATDLKYQKMTPSILKRCKHKNYCQSRYFIDRILTKIWFHTYSPFYWYQTTNYKQTLYILCNEVVKRDCKSYLITAIWLYVDFIRSLRYTRHQCHISYMTPAVSLNLSVWCHIYQIFRFWPRFNTIIYVITIFVR